jgi:protein required for attachment to host cells
MKRYTSTDLFDPKTNRTWFTLANRTEAKIYLEKMDHQFHLVECLSNPQGNLTETKLDSDKPGRTSARGQTVQHALDRHFGKHEQIAVEFAASIGDYLNSAAQKDLFDEIVIVAEPHFLGLLNEQVSQHSIRKKIRTLDREFVHGTIREIRKKVLEALSIH